ncbi:MAG: hypothetical protein R2849_07320 [Thermomicrobiales bacterium]
MTSEEEREAALDLASWVQGVDEITDDMELREFDIDSPNALFQSISSIEEEEGVTDDPMIAASEDWPTSRRPIRRSV